MNQHLIKSILTSLILLASLSIISACSSEASKEEGKEEQIEKGPQGGRLLNKDSISLELVLFSQGMPPHFRAYVYQNNQQIDPKDAKLTMELTRFNHKKENITFVPDGDFLQSNQVIREPHSFDVAAQLTLSGQNYSWNYSNYEGRVELLPPTLKAADIETATATSQTIKTQLKVVGKIVPNRDTMAPIYARYAGIIQTMNKNLGEEVKKGEPLVTIESNESLQNYTINAPITGTIVQKYATNGELAQSTKPVYDVANLNDVWADFTLYRKEAPEIKKGMTVRVTGDDGKPDSTSIISYIAPLGIEDSQTTLARAVLSNQNRLWLPGMYVNGEVVIKEKTVPVAVALSAIQRLGEQEVVFVQQGNFFEATPVSLGQQDNEWVEIRSGLDAGQRYVIKNSFFIKAELGKEGASHDD
ncbi:TPA: efflux RND transporter periplasmic adaptor subunit [Legionella pneumophila]|uniref:efflux RND transporter periplasmic adaptor subunit n=1 Tax=Legionella anisa TaxID=28082 RepID=UPI00034C0491|nr:efflux RND transporter periplasmic adaptor subunit [Legionella anisa]AWN75904.1 cation transporter [Legionella anisa]MCW8426829.1 efflux RND transporter periplasmic adaptor subunit [Legionella anisa]MCW8449503.1 efflux RND transporter periplasmic adaptor subunit [Legionella anisa]